MKLDATNQMVESFKNGKLTKVDPTLIDRARELYVAQFYTVAKVAKDTNVPATIVRRWVYVFQWDKERSDSLKAFWSDHAGVLADGLPDVDIRTDSIANDLESIIEAWVHGKLQELDEEGSDGIDMKQLANATKILGDVAKLRKEVIRGQKAQEASPVTLDFGQAIKDASYALIGDNTKVESDGKGVDVEFENGRETGTTDRSDTKRSRKADNKGASSSSDRSGEEG